MEASSVRRRGYVRVVCLESQVARVLGRCCDKPSHVCGGNPKNLQFTDEIGLVHCLRRKNVYSIADQLSEDVEPYFGRRRLTK